MKAKTDSSENLQSILDLVKNDLKNASNLHPDFIKDVVVPLLHAEEKCLFRINFNVQHDKQEEGSKQVRMPIFWSK